MFIGISIALTSGGGKGTPNKPWLLRNGVWDMTGYWRMDAVWNMTPPASQTWNNAENWVNTDPWPE